MKVTRATAMTTARFNIFCMHWHPTDAKRCLLAAVFGHGLQVVTLTMDFTGLASLSARLHTCAVPSNPGRPLGVAAVDNRAHVSLQSHGPVQRARLGDPARRAACSALQAQRT